MGCVTGCIANIFLTLFNIAVAINAVAVLTLATILTTYLGGYGDLIPKEVFQVLNGLQSVGPFVLGLGVIGMVVFCCCRNKLCLYTYFILGVGLIIVILALGGIGASKVHEKTYQNEILTNMNNDLSAYDFRSYTDFDKTRDKTYNTNECCGVHSYLQWSPYALLPNQLPKGCCKDYDADSPKTCIMRTVGSVENFYRTGCYDKMVDDCKDIVSGLLAVSIIFGVLLFVMLVSTCLCVKCTEALPF